MWFGTIGLPGEKYVNWSKYNYLLTLCLAANGKIRSETRTLSESKLSGLTCHPPGGSPPAHHLNSIFLKYFHNNTPQQNTTNTRATPGEQKFQNVKTINISLTITCCSVGSSGVVYRNYKAYTICHSMTFRD